ncbi:hypothetical protein HY640_00430 [Candidatus Woesearchaeota archaeon]|nr:hypothetical protein [Candidatus Woesearchaeota archaeon]
MLNGSVSGGICFPVGIFFDDRLSALEAITKFLREEHGLRYSEIASVLNRDERTVWCTYRNASTKSSGRLSCSGSDILIPVSAVGARELSVLETITEYLKEDMNLSFSRIAFVLRRDYRTVWTVYRRAKRKRAANA